MKLKSSLPVSFVFGLVLLLSSCLNGEDDNFYIQLAEDVDEIDTYLTANNIQAIQDIYGVRYTVDILGKGYAPKLSDNVMFDYTGRLLDGTVVETKSYSSYVAISDQISGFQIGIPQMLAGSTVTLYIPSGYAYGSTSTSTIPANSILVCTVKLKTIEPVDDELEQLDLDTLALDDFFSDNSQIVNVIKDTTGLRYTIDEVGTGISPGWYNRVNISYVGYMIIDGHRDAEFSEGVSEPSTSTDSRVISFIRGFQHGLQKMKKGGKATFYIPSSLAFGTTVVTGSNGVSVPANTNVIYEVELIDVYDP